MRIVEYIPRTRELYAPLPPYRWADNRGLPVPWTPLAEPIPECRVMLLGTGGVHLEDQEPFHFKDDTSIRVLPSSSPMERLRIAHFGYPTADAEEDPGCVFPLEPLARLVGEGVIGELTPSAIGMMGGIYSQRRVLGEVVPAVLERLRSEDASLLYAVPA